MRAQWSVNKRTELLNSKSAALAILLVLSSFQTARAYRWERVVGGPSPGIIITNKRPLCLFSPTHFGIETPYEINFSIVKLDSFNRVIECYYEGTGRGFPIETYIFNATYIKLNHRDKVTGFMEYRHYPRSRSIYFIKVSDVSYHWLGWVLDDYNASVVLLRNPQKAADPSPANRAEDQHISVDLSWSDGGDESSFATSYDVYFGTDRSPDESEFIGSQTETTYDPGALECDTTYYWRIDSRNLKGTRRGTIWRFTTTSQVVNNIIHVDINAAGANDGSSWADACNYLQDALMIASAGDEIRIAQGIYKPDQGIDITRGDREATLHLKEGVSLRGGYAGSGEPYPDAHNIEIYKTILSGDLDGNDNLNFINNDENSYHVTTTVDGTDETSVIEGCTITGGNANGPFPHNTGGGMYNINSKPTVNNCIFSGNYADEHGGGIHNYSNSNPSLTNCIFSGNYALQYGGGLSNEDNCSPILTNCTLTGNYASKGYGIYNYLDSSTILTNCIIWDGGNEIWNERDSIAAVTYSDIFGGFSGEGNIDVEPQFAEPGHWVDINNPSIVVDPDDQAAVWIKGDYHLKSETGRWDPISGSWVIDDVTSLCIDAGNPNISVGDEPAPNGGIINMGAYGGTAEASKSPEN